MNDIFVLPEGPWDPTSSCAFLSSSVNGLVITNDEGISAEIPVSQLISGLEGGVGGLGFASFDPDLFGAYDLKKSAVNPNGKYLLLYGSKGCICLKKDTQRGAVIA